MCVEGQRSRIFGSDNWRRWSKNGERKGAGSNRVASAKIVKDVQKFLGLVNYYRRFVKDFAKIARPLHEMTRKENKWSWRERQQKAFEELKKRFTIEPVLVTPNLDKEMRVKADTSDFVTKEVLSMKCENKKWKPVVYISKLLNEAEKNYKIYNKEILVIIQCLEA